MNDVPEGRQHNPYRGYWSKRSNLMYYQYVDFLVRRLAADAGSLIDVGSANARYIENFAWIPKRNTLDIRNPYASENVAGIEMNFFDFEPEEKYDFATCLQVLEHIPDAKSFAKKLFEVADRVLISVPYNWKEGSNPDHIHDPVDSSKLLDWTGREPSYSIVVEEPLSRSPKRNRLICYYHPEGEKLDFAKMRKGTDTTPTIKTLRKQLHELTKLLEQEVEAKRERNDALEERSNKRDSDLKEMREKRRKATQERDRSRRLYAEIEQSRSWRYTLPVRRIVSLLKRLV